VTELAIRLDGISKLYELGTGRYGALRDTLSSLVTALRALRCGGDRTVERGRWRT
jgi:hypothetical protein